MTEITNCIHCPARIRWKILENGTRQPLNLDGSDHDHNNMRCVCGVRLRWDSEYQVVVSAVAKTHKRHNCIRLQKAMRRRDAPPQPQPQPQIQSEPKPGHFVTPPSPTKPTLDGVVLDAVSNKLNILIQRVEQHEIRIRQHTTNFLGLDEIFHKLEKRQHEELYRIIKMESWISGVQEVIQDVDKFVNRFKTEHGEKST